VKLPINILMRQRNVLGACAMSQVELREEDRSTKFIYY